MNDIVRQAFVWLKAHPEVGWISAGVSFVLILVSVTLLPLLLARIPDAYFQDRRTATSGAPRHAIVRILRNALGGTLIVLGLAMLVLPGQGLLTMLAGLILTDVPGKYRIERWVITRPAVLRVVQRLRTKRGVAPLRLKPSESAAEE